MKIIINMVLGLLFMSNVYTQNVGIGTSSPTERLEVNGNVKASGLLLTQGNPYDLVKKGAGEQLVFSKGSKGIGLNYIIAISGIFPIEGGSTVTYSNTILGEVRLFAGSFAPPGFRFCDGQLLSINANLALFSLIGTTYGGNGVTSFALPDLRGAVPVGTGIPVTGAAWIRGEVN